MPPKRKRADADPDTATRSTRSSARLSKADHPASEDNVPATKAKRSKATTATVGSDREIVEKTKSAPKTKGRSSKAKGTKATAIFDEHLKLDDDNDTKVQAGPSKTDSITSKTNSLIELYTRKRSLALFEAYADPDDPEVIGPEGFERLCMDTDISLEGALPLVLAWQLDAKEMGKFSKDEWVKGMGELEIACLPALFLALKDLESLLVLNVEPSRKSMKSGSGSEVYRRTRYQTYTRDRKNAFVKLYQYCFSLAKPEQARNIDMETALAFWSVLLVPRYSVMSDVIGFINDKGSYKGVNKDIWTMMLEFCQTVKPTLEDYEADGAWPTLLDDFVAWKKSKTTGEGS